MSASLAIAFCLAGCPSPQTPIEKPCPPVDYPVAITQAPPPPAETSGPRTLEVRLAPTRDDAGALVAIDVAMRYSVPPVDFGDADPIVLRLESAQTNPERIDDLVARDSEGSLGLRRVEAEAGKPAQAEWRSERRARGPVTVNYRFELPSAGADSDEVAVSAGGIVGLGRAMFLLPATTETHTIRVRWDLQGLGEGARGSSSFGGNESEIEGAPAKLKGAIWAAGKLDEFSIHSGAAGNARFRLVSIGGGPLDVVEVGPWANRMWFSARTVATETPQSQFDLFVRSTGKTGSRFDVNVIGGSGVAVVDNGVQFGWPEKLRIARAFIRAARGPALAGTRWVDEGFVAYHALEAMRRSGLATPNEIAAELAKRAERYLASPWLRTPMMNLEKEKDPAALDHAEDRGFWYAAEMDGKLRMRTFGKKSFEDVWRAAAPKAESSDDGAIITLSPSAFFDALTKEIGPDAASRLADVVLDADSSAAPPDDTFGPCFKKQKKKIQREQPGEKKRETVDGFTFSLAPKPVNCGATAQVGGLQKTP